MDKAEFIAYHGKRGAALQSFGRASPGARPGQRLQRPGVWYDVDLSTWTFDYDWVQIGMRQSRVGGKSKASILKLTRNERG